MSVVPRTAGAAGPFTPVASAPNSPSVSNSAGVAQIPRIGQQLRYQVVRVGPAGQAGFAALVAAAVVAVSVLVPARHVIEGLSADIARAKAQPGTAVGDGDGLSRVLSTLPTRDQVPAVLGQVFQEARNAGVQLNSGHYTFAPAKPGGVARYELEFPVMAGYPDIRYFINRTLTAVPAVGLEKLHFERKAVGDGIVSADVHFVVFVRGE